MEDFGNDNDNQDELDQISTVALLIDDLSSEDPSKASFNQATSHYCPNFRA